jgi:hypothetical protein
MHQGNSNALHDHRVIIMMIPTLKHHPGNFIPQTQNSFLKFKKQMKNTSHAGRLCQHYLQEGRL